MKNILSIVTSVSVAVIASTSITMAQGFAAKAPVAREVARPADRLLEKDVRDALGSRIAEKFGKAASEAYNEALTGRALTRDTVEAAAIQAVLAAREGSVVSIDAVRGAKELAAQAFDAPQALRATTVAEVASMVSSVGKPTCEMIRNSSVTMTGDFLAQKANFEIIGNGIKSVNADAQGNPLVVMDSNSQAFFYSLISNDFQVQEGGKVLLERINEAKDQYLATNVGPVNMGKLKDYVWENGIAKALLEAGESRENVEKFKKECPVI